MASKMRQIRPSGMGWPFCEILAVSVTGWGVLARALAASLAGVGAAGGAPASWGASVRSGRGRGSGGMSVLSWAIAPASGAMAVTRALAIAAAIIRRLAESMKLPNHPLAFTDRCADSIVNARAGKLCHSRCGLKTAAHWAQSFSPKVRPIILFEQEPDNARQSCPA